MSASGVVAAAQPGIGFWRRIDPGTLVGVVTTLVVAYLLVRVLTVALTAVAEHAGTRRITVKTLLPIVKFLIYGAAVYSILFPLLDLQSAELVALGGLLGAALGLGLKDLFAELFGGIVLLLERPYQVGDKVSAGGTYGEVMDIGLRSTTVVTPDDSVVAVPNDVLFGESLSNANDGAPEMQVVTEVYVANDADAEQAAAILEEAMLSSRFLYLSEDRPVTILVEDGPYHRTVRGKAYVNDLRDEFRFESDVTRRTLAAFERAGIETPDPRLVAGESGE